MRNMLVFYFALLKTSMKSSMGKRAAFLVESGLMLLNNLIFFTIWWIFFRQFKSIDGWNIQDMIVLMAVGSGSYGLMGICFGGVKTLSQVILNGDLDPFMTQPKNLLLHITGSQSLPKHWGHIMTAFAFLAIGGLLTSPLLPLLLLSMVSGGLVFTSINIIAHSLAFWLGSIESVSKKYCDSLFLFALYPTNIYSGMLQVVMFTLIPAGVITFLPVELLRHFSWAQLFILLGSSLLFFLAACQVFYSGLKRYESGNKFGPRL